MRRTFGLLVLMLLAIVPFGACSDDGGTASGSRITVFAAASLTDAFNEIGEAFEVAHPGRSVTFNFAGSPALVTQLDQGAAADVLATADERNMAVANEKDLVVEDIRTFARNKLVIIVPSENPGGIEEPADLANRGLRLVLAEADVPAGAYARRSLELLNASPGYGDDFSRRVLANLASEEPNVKAVVTKVQLGEADAGIVYVTDVSDDVASDIRVIEIPDEYNVVASYPIAVTTGARAAETAQAFVEFVLSDEGQAILERYGFIGVDQGARAGQSRLALRPAGAACGRVPCGAAAGAGVSGRPQR